MELTYLDNNFLEKGAILDFNIDLAYGKDENNFEMKTPENKMTVGDFWSCGSYGGIVDEIAKVSNEENVTYRGRSLQGIIDNFSCYQLKDANVLTINGNSITVNGLPSEILKTIIEQLEIPFSVGDADEEEENITITVERSLSVYELFLAIPNYKLVFDYERNVGFEVRLTGSIDYTKDDYFDATQYSVNISVDNKIPNHLIGIYKKEDRTIVKHLYFDEDGNIQPYYVLDSDNQNPMHDAEYERIEDNQIIKGKNEIVEVIEGGSTIENLVVVTPKTETDGNTDFDGSVPSDWNENFMNYYQEEWDAENLETVFNKLPVEPNYSVLTIPSAQWWQVNWGAYYKRVLNEETGEYEFKQLTESDVNEKPQYVKIANAGTVPNDWETEWENYYRKYATDDYQHFEGVSIPDYYKETSVKETPKWKEDRGSYYINWKREKWNIKVYAQKRGGWKKVDAIEVKDSLTLANPTGSNHSFAWWKKEHGSTFIVSQNVPNVGVVKTKYVISKPTIYKTEWITLKDYCETVHIPLTGKNGIKWKQFTLWIQYELRVDPPIVHEDIYKLQTLSGSPSMSGTYYKEDGVVIPPYYQGKIYRKIEDNYTNLIEKMLERLNEIKNSAIKIEPSIDADVGEFDIGDIIGGTHPFANQTIKSVIAKKIVKINSDGIIISYEI